MALTTHTEQHISKSPSSTPKKRKEDKIHRLLEMLVEEISLVDFGANNEQWLLRKRDEQEAPMLGPEVHTDEEGRHTTEKTPTDKACGKDEEHKESTKQAEEMPSGVKSKVASMLGTASSQLASVIELVKGATETDEKMPEPVPADLSAKLKSIYTVLRGILSQYPSPVSGEKEVSEKALTLPGPVKSKFMTTLEEASNRLMSVITWVKETKETDAEMPSPIPERIGKEIIAIADLIEGLMKAYPSPKSATAKAEQDESQEKRGAALSRERRIRFRQAMQMLSEILAEVDPEAKNPWPTRKATDEKVNKMAETQKTEVEELKERLAKAEKAEVESKAEVARLKKELEKEMKTAQPSNSANVDTAKGDSVEKNDDAFMWPDDMNDPIS